MRMLTVAVAVVMLALAGSASAQPLTLEFHDGRVTVDATAVPVRTILAEWARLGGTKVVNGDRIVGAPLTIRLENVTEAQALDVILRNVAGYVAAPRRADASGASVYDRILVMPTSTVVASAPSGPAGRLGQNGNTAGLQRGPRPAFAPVPQDDPTTTAMPVADESDTGVNEPPFQFPPQNPFQAVGQPGAFGTPVAPGGQPAQFGQPDASGVTVNPALPQQMPVLQFPGAPPSAAPPTGGFGIVGSPTPGTVVQPPTQPGQRPPGGF